MKNIIIILFLTTSIFTNINAQCNATVTGIITNIADVDVQEQKVHAVVNGNIVSSTTVDAAGKFELSLSAVPTNAAYDIQIEGLSESRLENVSTLDLVLIQKHILHVELFDNSFDRIVGDINCDGVISAVDMVYLRRLILGIDQVFVGGDFCYVSDNGPLQARTCSDTSNEPLMIQAYKKGNVSD